MKTTKLSESTLAKIDELGMRYCKEFDRYYSREEIIDKALVALEEIADEW